MRFLADAGISPQTIEFLRQRGHDAVHAREIAMLSGQAAALESGTLVLIEDTRYRIKFLPIRR